MRDESEKSGGLEIWESGDLGVWRFGSLEVWESGGLGVWKFGSLEVWESGGLEVWRDFSQGLRGLMEEF
jgi:hypothetical protein